MVPRYMVMDYSDNERKPAAAISWDILRLAARDLL